MKEKYAHIYEEAGMTLWQIYVTCIYTLSSDMCNGVVHKHMPIYHLYIWRMTCWWYCMLYSRQFWPHFLRCSRSFICSLVYGLPSKTTGLFILIHTCQYRSYTSIVIDTWWRHQMEAFSALLAFFGALMFSLICVWINGWVNTRDAGDLRRHRDHYDVTVM